MSDFIKPSKPVHPTPSEIRERHQQEPDQIRETSTESDSRKQQNRSNIFATERAPNEVLERQRQRLEAMVALKAVFRIFDIWKLTDEQMKSLLGNPEDKSFSDFKHVSVYSLSEEILIRISHIMNIYRALRILFPTEQRAASWVHRSNRAFDGLSALDLMMGGDFAQVRNYLNGQYPDDSNPTSKRDSST